MNSIAIKTNSETAGQFDHNREYIQRFSVLDLLGLTNSVSPTAYRPKTLVPAEEENYNKLIVVDWAILGEH